MATATRTAPPPASDNVDIPSELEVTRQELRDAIEQQIALGDVLKAIGEARIDLQPVFDTINEHAARLCRARTSTIFLVEGEHVRLAASSNREPAFLEIAVRTPPRIDRGSTVGRAVLERRTIHLPDVLADPEYARVDLAHAGDFRTALAVPFFRDGVPIGVLSTGRREVRPFTDREIRLVEAFAGQAAIAIENVRLFSETNEALERQTAISEVLRAMSSSPTNAQSVLNAIAQNATRFCAAEDAIVALLRGAQLELAAHDGVVTGVPQTWPADRTTVSGRCVVDRRTIHVPDVQVEADEFPIGAELARTYGFRTILATPLLRDGVPLGAILLRRLEARPFSERQLELLRAFADQAVIAIENVRLFNETKEALERQTATAEVLRAISGSPSELQPVLDAIVANASRFCRAEDVTVALVYGDQLRLRAHFGAIGLPTFEWRLDRDSATGRAVLDGQTIELADVQAADAEFPVSARLARESGHRTMLATPLVREGRAIGCIFLRRPEIRRFTPAEIDLVETFAAQAVIAIENVRLFNETKEKSAQLEAANDELAAASRHKSEFLANMSHELRTPLNAIIGFSDVLDQRMFGQLNDQQSQYVRDIAGSGRHLLDLVNEILDLAKIEAGRMELEPSDFALAETIRGALAFVRERAAAQRIELDPQLPEDLGTLVADERKMRQVLLNLLSNAVKFTPDGGRVALRARRIDSEVVVSVQDTGIGIAPEDQPKVFEEFRQVGKTSDRSREGTGLGLTLAKRFIELHGGRIWVESEVGKGTTFTFAIPTGPAAATPA